MFKIKFYNLVVRIFFICTSLTSVSLASSDAPDIRSFELWSTDQGATLLGIKCLETLKTELGELDETTRKYVGSAFSGLLYHYEVLDLTPSKKEDLATRIREFESLLAAYIKAGKINHADLWLDDMPELEVVFITEENLGKLRSEGKIRGKIPADILDIIRRGGDPYCNITDCATVSPRFSRLPSIFDGSKLLVGGERSVPEASHDYYMLNFFSSMHPDIIGYAENPSSLVAIPDSKFTSIEFNFLDHTILLNEEILREYYRVLAPGGTFTFKTNHNSADYCQSIIKAERKQAQKNLRVLFKKTVKVEDQKDSHPHWLGKPNAHFVIFEVTK